MLIEAGGGAVSQYICYYNGTVTHGRAGANFTLGAVALVNPVFAIPYGISEVFISGGLDSVIAAGVLVRQEFKNVLGVTYNKWWFPKKQFLFYN